jgi:nitronate monooxygenase
VDEVRDFFDGTLVVGGAISTGRGVRAVETLGAELAYMGTRFIACPESLVQDSYRQMLIRAGAGDVTATAGVTGVACSWLTESLRDAGYGDAQLSSTARIDFSDVHGEQKPWKDIFGAGQGVGQIDRIETVGEVADKIVDEYLTATNTFIGTAS